MSTQTVTSLAAPRPDTQTRVRVAVKGLMAMTGMQQKDLATVLGMSTNNANHKLTGRSKFTLEEVELLAQHFDVDVVDLLEPGRWRPRGPRGGGLLRLDSNQEPAGFRTGTRLSPRALRSIVADLPAQRLAPAA